MTVTAYDLTMFWSMGKIFVVHLEVGRLVLGKFQSFQLQYRRASQPGVWVNAGTKTLFNPTLLFWLTDTITEGEDYVFELTVTETSGVVTVTEDWVNAGFA